MKLIARGFFYILTLSKDLGYLLKSFIIYYERGVCYIFQPFLYVFKLLPAQKSHHLPGALLRSSDGAQACRSLLVQCKHPVK